MAVVNDRVEYFEGSPFQTVVSRAFASLADAYTLALRLLAEGGAMVAMKGKLDPTELAALKAQSACVVDTQRVRPVGVEGERTLWSLNPLRGSKREVTRVIAVANQKGGVEKQQPALTSPRRWPRAISVYW